MMDGRHDRTGERLDEVEDQAEHPADCSDGWIGSDPDRPIPCPRCRPRFYTCERCQADREACHARRLLGGDRCCPGCTHAGLPRRRVA